MIQIDETKYYIEKETLIHGTVRFTCVEKKRNCERCKQLTDTKLMEIIHYTDKSKYRRHREVCKGCYNLLKVYIN